MKRFRWWTATEKEILKLHYGPLSKVPWPLARICAALGLSSTDVCSAARRYGLAWRHWKPLSDWELMPLYLKGWTDRRIGRATEHDPSLITRWRNKHGLPRNYKGSKPHDATTARGNQ